MNKSVWHNRLCVPAHVVYMPWSLSAHHPQWNFQAWLCMSWTLSPSHAKGMITRSATLTCQRSLATVAQCGNTSMTRCETCAWVIFLNNEMVDLWFLLSKTMRDLTRFRSNYSLMWIYVHLGRQFYFTFSSHFRISSHVVESREGPSSVRARLWHWARQSASGTYAFISMYSHRTI